MKLFKFVPPGESPQPGDMEVEQVDPIFGKRKVLVREYVPSPPEPSQPAPNDPKKGEWYLSPSGLSIHSRGADEAIVCMAPSDYSASMGNWPERAKRIVAGQKLLAFMEAWTKDTSLTPDIDGLCEILESAE